MLKTLGSTKSTTRPEKSRFGVGGDDGSDNVDDSGHNDEYSTQGSG